MYLRRILSFEIDESEFSDTIYLPKGTVVHYKIAQIVIELYLIVFLMFHGDMLGHQLKVNKSVIITVGHHLDSELR